MSHEEMRFLFFGERRSGFIETRRDQYLLIFIVYFKFEDL